MAEPAETKAYEDALAVFRQGDFATAANVFSDFTRRYPRSGYGGGCFVLVGQCPVRQP